MAEAVLYEVRGNVACITLNRPEVLNAVNPDLLEGIRTNMARAAEDDDVRIVILTGAGRGFCAGADLTSRANADQPPPPDATEVLLNTRYKPTLMAIAEMKKPVISAINGAAAGVGSAFAMIADLTIMADNAYILQAFSNIGLIPDGGATWLLSNTIGYKRAYQLAVEAERIPAERCLEMGLANKVVPADALMDEAWTWAEKIAQRPPLSLKYTKKAMRMASQISLADAISLEASFQQVCSNSEDSKEGAKAFFEKRPPNFTGR